MLPDNHLGGMGTQEEGAWALGSIPSLSMWRWSHKVPHQCSFPLNCHSLLNRESSRDEECNHRMVLEGHRRSRKGTPRYLHCSAS